MCVQLRPSACSSHLVLRTNTEPDHGSCHCGAVTLAVKVDKPLEERDITVDEERICECNCSVCVRVRLSLTQPQTDHLLMYAADTCTGGIHLDLSAHGGFRHRGQRTS